MSHVFNLLAALMNDAPDREKGQGLVEYALILALIAIVVVVAMQFLGTQISTILSTVGSSV